MRSWETFLKVSGWTSELESVSRFLRHYSRMVRSEKTRENVCFALKGLCESVGRGPDQLVKTSPEEASELLQGYVDSLADKGYSIRYVNVCLAYLKTFFKVNGFKGAKALEVERRYQPARYRKRSEYIPTSSQIYDMAFAAGSIRNKALVFALYTSGLRNSTLRALLYGDVKEEIQNGMEIVKLPVYPQMKKVDTGACKGNIPYYSFISKDAVEALLAYCTERRQIHGSIEEDEPLFASDSRNVPPETRRHTLVMKKSLEAMVKRAARNAGIRKWRAVYPHCLRKAFESALRNSGMDPKDQEFLMGHILPRSQDTYYDKTKIEDLRRKYVQVDFFPQRAYPSEQLRKKQVLDTARLLGFPEDRIKRVEEALAKYATVDDAMEEIRKLSLEGYKLRENPNSDPKKVIDEGELENYLARGWDVQTVLPSGRILVKK